MEHTRWRAVRRIGDDPLSNALANQRLRTALSLEGEWLPGVLSDAVYRLREVRRGQPNAGGLVIATDQEHARDIARLLSWEFRVTATVVTSDDPGASERIASFAVGSGEWLVAVRMVSEEVDIPRLRVGVYATTTTTDLFFRQAVGRSVRWEPEVRNQRAWLYVPDDARLRTWAALIAKQHRHSLRRDASRGSGGSDRREPAGSSSDAGEVELAQLSLFAPVSAVATQTAAMSPWHELLPDDWSAADGGVELELAPLPVAWGTVIPADGSTRRQTKDALRAANAAAARDLARRTGLSHARINAELNRLAGVRRVTDATVVELQARLDHAERWLARV